MVWALVGGGYEDAIKEIKATKSHRVLAIVGSAIVEESLKRAQILRFRSGETVKQVFIRNQFYPHPMLRADSDYPVEPTGTHRKVFLANMRLAMTLLMRDTYSHMPYSNVPTPLPEMSSPD